MPFVRLLAILSLFLLSAAPAGAVDESDFCNSGDDPCVFSGAELNVPEDTALDFGSRTLIIGSSKRINITGGRTLSIIAGSFVMQTGARIGNVTATATGANVTVTTTGDIRLEKGGLESRSRIELPGTIAGGAIQFTAGGNVVVDGELRVNGLNADAPGGSIDIEARGDVTVGALAPASLSGGLAELGGSFNVSADGPIVISGDIDASGGLGGGSIDISGLGSLTTTGALDVRGRAAGSFGGELLIAMEGAVTIGGKVFAQGVGGIVEGGGSGGEIDMSAGASMLLNEVIDLSGGAPEGDGGFADFVAEVDVFQKRQVRAVGDGTGGSGGVVSFEAGRLLSFESLNDVGGSLAGGDFTGTSRGEIQVKSDIKANGDGAGGSGGTILLDGRVPGVAQVSGSVTVSAALRTRGDVGGLGGGISLVGCNVTVAGPGVLDNFGPQASNAILASGLMTILGNVQALPTGSGENTLQFRDLDKQPVISDPMLIDPFTPPTRNANLPGCEPPPPLICGNGDPTGVEGCDDGNVDSCDGCSGSGGAYAGPPDAMNPSTCHTAAVPCCQLESCGNGRRECDELCDDGNVEDGDGCDSNCTPTACGNGRVTTGEECDDGNTVSGDGCTGDTCQVEPPPGCGDGVRSDSEECDDDNTTPCDGCSKICVVERCGNGANECAEVCDDGGTVACDGECAADCSHTVACGDGTTECDERCDSGEQNGAPGSGCSAFCQTCTIGSGSDCPCDTDFDCAPAGRCGGLACLSGACASVDIPVCNDGNVCNGVEACADGACTVPTPPACVVDDDPCTDTCNPTGGANPCPRKTGFAGISCRLDFIVSRADNASVEELPTKLRAKILRLAGASRDRINQAATETKVKRQRKLLKSAEAQLSKLLKAINKGLAKGQIAEALATRFVQEADGARGDTRTLRAGITG